MDSSIEANLFWLNVHLDEAEKTAEYVALNVALTRLITLQAEYAEIEKY